MSFTRFILALYSLYTRFNVALIEIMTRPKKRGTQIGEIRLMRRNLYLEDWIKMERG